MIHLASVLSVLNTDKFEGAYCIQLCFVYFKLYGQEYNPV